MLYLSEPVCAIHSGAVDKEGVEEHGIARSHLQVYPRGVGIIVSNTVVHFVHTTLHMDTTDSQYSQNHTHTL